jgi:circadian clock protein KaiB
MKNGTFTGAIKTGGIRPPGRIVLRLFVAGATARSQQAILYVRHLCEVGLKGRISVEVIDIYQQPKLARVNQIVATPTLIREHPKPVRRYIGNLAAIDELALGMVRTPKAKDRR